MATATSTDECAKNVNILRYDAMTFSNALKTGASVLNRAGVDSPALEAIILFCGLFDLDKVFVYSHPENEIFDEQYLTFTKAISERASGTPAQYILGTQEFMSLDFIVSPAVLIPRPETELLVETAMEFIGKASVKNGPEVLDIGTGSGCIAVSIAHYLKNCRVTAADISPACLEIARLNSEKHGVSERIEFIISDLFKNLPGRKYDVILSNPPYIPTHDISTLQMEVREHEPIGALDGGADGLKAINSIIEKAPAHLKNGGMLALEIGIGQEEKVGKLMNESFASVRIKKDLQGIPRVMTGIKRATVLL
ncbi:MAG: peptide chain release factor N(5)-glutamine methyltransferase [Eubacteriales bacterium]|nr:peptide chain release factor N(5)-glutamine methyltransferase [Eubacteriales bacterium]